MSELEVTRDISKGSRPWWVAVESAHSNADQCAVAYYRHSAQGKQKNSIELQSERVQEEARKRGLSIIREYADRGHSGMTANRPAFQQVLAAARERKDFKYIMVLNVSRWGRFDDSNEFGRYEAECRQNGKEMLFVEQDYSASGPLGNIVMEVHRYLSAEESRNKSDKVFRGSIKVSQQGFRAGAPAPYGFARALYDENGNFREILPKGKPKSIANDRVKLIPAGNEKSEIVKSIFSKFVHDRMDEAEIALSLNASGVPSPSGKLWNSCIIKRILDDQQYAGTVVYNRTSRKLHTRSVRNPRGHWVVTPNAFEGIVNEEVFELARQRLELRLRRFDKDVMLTHIRRLRERFGIVTGKIIENDKKSPKTSVFLRKFGSVSNAVQHLFEETIERVKRNIMDQLASEIAVSESHSDFIVLDRKLTVLVQPAIPLQIGYGYFWFFKPDPRAVIDITLGAALAIEDPSKILGYFAFPRLMLGGNGIRLSASSEGIFELHAAMGLNFIKGILA